jgi:hypothetical protein
MPARNENNDYSSLRPPVLTEKPDGENGRDYASVSAFKRREKDGSEVRPRGNSPAKTKPETVEDSREYANEPVFNETVEDNPKPISQIPVSEAVEALPEQEEDRSHVLRKEKGRKVKERDQALLQNDNWLLRNGHSVSYAGIFLFTMVLYFRPYELFPALSGLTGLAFFISIATLVFFIPSQLAVEGNLTARPAEVNYLLLLTLLGIATIPIARSPGTAWETFNDVFIKIVLMFIVMVNVLRTELRLKGLMWLSLGVGLMLSIDALKRYMAGEFTVEDYRVSVQFGGMFGNPNELAVHFVMFIPIAVVLGLSTRNFVMRIVYWATAVLMTAGTVVTFSRGGFLGLIIASLVLGWKLGRKNRFQVMAVMAILGLAFLALAPGNYGVRILSIFIPGLDPVGSSNQRSELLKQSIWVTLRNPWGVGMGNFSIGSSHNLVTHNAYTQVSSELGIVGLVIYVLFVTSPFRRLGAIERELFDNEEYNWMYYLAIGIQASIVAYMVASFFGAFAYNWFVYYPVAYAIALRRIYLTGKEIAEKKDEARTAESLDLQTA